MTYLHWGLTLLLSLLLWAAATNRGRRRVLLLAASIGLFLWAWVPTTWLLSGSLEWWYPVAKFPAAPADAIVVLSASISLPDASQPQPLPGFSTYVRCRHAAWLYQNWRAAPIVVSGGIAGRYQGEAVVMAEVMRRTIEAEGVPASMIHTEGTSTSTYENATHSAAILRGMGVRRIALVTEAYHMLRAEKVFRKQGLEVVPAPCGYRTAAIDMDWKELAPTPQAMAWNDDTIHEWAGLFWYWLARRI